MLDIVKISIYFFTALIAIGLGAYIGFSILSFSRERKKKTAQADRIAFAHGYGSAKDRKRKEKRAAKEEAAEKKAEAKKQKAEEKKQKTEAKQAAKEEKRKKKQEHDVPHEAQENADEQDKKEGLLGSRISESDSYVQFLCNSEGDDIADKVESLRVTQDEKYARAAAKKLENEKKQTD